MWIVEEPSETFDKTYLAFRLGYLSIKQTVDQAKPMENHLIFYLRQKNLLASQIHHQWNRVGNWIFRPTSNEVATIKVSTNLFQPSWLLLKSLVNSLGHTIHAVKLIFLSFQTVILVWIFTTGVVFNDKSEGESRVRLNINLLKDATVQESLWEETPLGESTDEVYSATEQVSQAGHCNSTTAVCGTPQLVSTRKNCFRGCVQITWALGE